MSCQTCNNIDENTTMEFDIDISLSDSLEKEYFVWNGLLQILAQFTSDTKWKPDEERYNAILDEYMESYIKYSLLFDGIKNKTIRENNLISSQFNNVGVNFINHKIKFYK